MLKLHVIGVCEGNSPGTGEFPAQMTSNAENVSIWWRHHDDLELPVTILHFQWPGAYVLNQYIDSAF